MTILFSLIILIAVVMIVFWIVDAMGVAYPISMIIKVIVGLLAIAKLLQLAGLGF